MTFGIQGTTHYLPRGHNGEVGHLLPQLRHRPPLVHLDFTPRSGQEVLGLLLRLGLRLVADPIGDLHRLRDYDLAFASPSVNLLRVLLLGQSKALLDRLRVRDALANASGPLVEHIQDWLVQQDTQQDQQQQEVDDLRNKAVYVDPQRLQTEAPFCAFLNELDNKSYHES